MLNIHSCYSMRYGLLQPQAIVDWAAGSGYQRIALTDINNTSAALSYIRLMQHAGLPAVVGIDFRNGITCRYIGIARNNHGFMELNRFLSTHLHTETPFPEHAPELKHCYVIYPWENAPAALRDNERIGIAPHQLNRFVMNSPENRERYVALAPMTFMSKQHFNTHRLLRAIDCNLLLSKLPAEAQTRPDEYYLGNNDLKLVYASCPWLVRQAEQLLEDCHVTFDFRDEAPPQNLAAYTGSIEEDAEMIRRLCTESLYERYQNPSPEVVQRIEKELEVIRQKNYLSYFLIAWDIVSHARSKGYFYVGRGSGANSIIAYLLRITDVDPLELDLYFERFINLYRKNPPDFDIDFSWRDRDDITQYIFNRFPNAAMICTYNTFQYKATVRELGKVFGLPKSEIDLLSNGHPKQPVYDDTTRLVLKYSSLIAELPSHLSVHAGGIVISEKPIHWFSATFLTSKGFPTTHYSMLEAEDVGLYKFDILSQRGLGKIKDCLDIIRYNQPHNPPCDIHQVHLFKEDDRVNRLLREAKATGCFYIESPGMRMLMTKLQTNGYLELVAASSIIRPGVAQSGMMREYIIRHRDPVHRKHTHPKMLELMPDTYGVMVYQEDVIKVANRFAGLSLAESDILRRGMSGKFRSRDEFRIVRDRFFKNCRENNYPEQLTKDVWQQIESFAGFAFSKGHSASYAVESYQSLYLKAYYPIEYMVATINNFGGFYRTELYVHEARMLGADIQPPCINFGQYETTVSGRNIVLGLQHILGLEQHFITQILDERKLGGLFSSLNDLLHRVPIPLEQLLLLIRSGALQSFGTSRKKLLWNAHLSFAGKQDKVKSAQLFFEEPKSYALPELEEHPLEKAFDEMELLGFPLQSPFSLLQEPLPEKVPSASDLAGMIGREITTFGYHIHTKRTSTKSGDTMLFGTFLDCNGFYLDTVHFPDSAAAFPFRGSGVYEIRGLVTSEFDFHVIEVSYLRKIAFVPDPRYSEG